MRVTRIPEVLARFDECRRLSLVLNTIYWGCPRADMSGSLFVRVVHCDKIFPIITETQEKCDLSTSFNVVMGFQPWEVNLGKCCATLSVKCEHPLFLRYLHMLDNSQCLSTLEPFRSRLPLHKSIPYSSMVAWCCLLEVALSVRLRSRRCSREKYDHKNS